MFASGDKQNPNTAQGKFTTTRWSVILAAQKPDSPQAANALETLCRTYWLPLYAYLRREGRDTHEAKDLTQEFLAEFLARNSLEKVEAARGRFRSYLLSCLKHFLCNEHDRRHAAKRGGGITPISWEELAGAGLGEFEPRADISPEQLFDRQWALTVLERAMLRLMEDFEGSARGKQFERLRGFLEGDVRSGDYDKAAAELNSSPGAVAIAVHRLRHRYRELVRSEIAETVGTEEDIDAEMLHLQQALAS